MQSTRWADPKASVKGSLSDQDLFETFLNGNLTMMSHEFIAFPSWWFHSDVFYKLLPDLQREHRSNESYYQTGRRMSTQLGAVHLSSGFHVVENEGTDKRRSIWHTSLVQGLKCYNKECPDDMSVSDWKRNPYEWSDINKLMDLLTGFADAVLFEHLDQRFRLQSDIKALLGTYTPQTGIGLASIMVGLAHEELQK